MSPPPGTSSKASKKVHYERGTKSGHHSHHRSRDSGFGSGSASDSASTSASLGSPDDAHEPTGFTSADISQQRHTLSALREALDAASTRARVLEAGNAELDAMLRESNNENRLLKRERKDLMREVEELREELDQGLQRKMSERLKRGERRTTPPRREKEREGGEVAYVRPGTATSERRSSGHRDQPPSLSLQNPFMPLPERSPVAAYPPNQLAYPPTTLPYVGGPPVFAQSPHRPSPPNDGRYHLTPI